MPKIARSGQDWILDRFIGTLGVNALMPGFMSFMASPIVGFNNADLDRIADRTQGVSSMRRAISALANIAKESRARPKTDGHLATARRHYYLASLAYGFAQYTIQEDRNAEKKAIHDKSQECFAKVIKFADGADREGRDPVHRRAGLRGEVVPGHPPAAAGQGAVAVRHLHSRHRHAQGAGAEPGGQHLHQARHGGAGDRRARPGREPTPHAQGAGRYVELRAGGERGHRLPAEPPGHRPQQDRHVRRQHRIVLVTARSCSGKPATRTASRRPVASPRSGIPPSSPSSSTPSRTSRRNYMYMAGEDSEAAFDSKAPLHDLREDIKEITCPILIVQGEFDELCTPETVEAIITKATAPYELRIYEDEFHPLGGVALEAYERAVRLAQGPPRRQAGAEKPRPPHRASRNA